MTVSVVAVQSVRQPTEIQNVGHTSAWHFSAFPSKTHRNDDGCQHRSIPRKKSPALIETARQWTRWENRSDRCHCCCRSITLAPVTSSNGCFAPVHQELPTAPHHQITTPRSHLSIFLLFMTQVLPLDIAMVELLPCLQFFCQLEGHFVSWAYDFERCGRGGGGVLVGGD